jgi:hypothetical protein
MVLAGLPAPGLGVGTLKVPDDLLRFLVLTRDAFQALHKIFNPRKQSTIRIVVMSSMKE